MGCAMGVLFYFQAASRPDPEDAFCPPGDRLAMATPDGLFDPDASCGPAEEVVEAAVSPGDTISGLLDRYIEADEITRLSRESREFRFSRIQAGQPYRIATRDGEFVSFEYAISPLERLVIRAERGEYLISVEAEPQTFRSEVAAGTIDQNLFAAVKDAGEDSELAVALADIFAWDIDFCKDLRQGDSFKVVVEKRYAGDAFTGYGRILAAEFTNQGKTSRAFYLARGKGKGGYFDEKGQALRKAFLRAPLSFRRISSGFTHSRLHPILHVRRPHLGVDYAAPEGTPVWSVGGGVVVEKGYNHAAGNFVTVRHNQTYTTRYNHLSRFAKALAKGKAVRQGEVVGYVGSTGYATGPHLDFRMYKNGQAINILENPKITADPVPSGKMAAFAAAVEPLVAMMRDHGKEKSVAQNPPGPRPDTFVAPSAPSPVELFAAPVIPLPAVSPTASATSGPSKGAASPAG
ncbi:peptidoglycan DD-metalloendopeptidase family protein [Desulfolutivibrio sulfoxidireducens]|uniref:peptidoglycan DD-metalloendopeptidase family protein n=1 Tax=Desulfolutivibrio sulfoxidireducens TaxID=2773299 RepID=UPI00159D6D27|nr:peptidoglycan DD-metalloendopeptidase family protein [Desulfolutivibrio sulfoxidireducens]QLA16022.1 peptidoglycan DD-metalloendopeptidase family protein [Desulfolutivibrio sulfoxidireducens]